MYLDGKETVKHRTLEEEMKMSERLPQSVVNERFKELVSGDSIRAVEPVWVKSPGVEFVPAPSGRRCRIE